ncbi:FecR family protein [Pseudoflavitalea rhizosphaerae]|uniref:FecR family protein n=1 Tax=Pseudoflavitalea rhizosphaerae TaxID=1884793 RepID=UPI000F8CCE56|nr:FecR domain-containing protein [Pseudoflavitalea rhizosphaerae]
MLDKLTEEEIFLLLGKISGSLSPEEEIELAALFSRNPHANAAYEELKHEIPVKNTAEYFSNRQQNPSWKDLTADIRNPVSAKLVPFYKKKWFAAAVVSGLVIGAGLMFLLKPFAAKEAKAPVAGIAKPGIELILADGKVIDLSKQQGTIDAGPAKLNNTGKQLNYSLTGSAAPGNSTLNVPVGADYRINLADGTEVWLNSKTRLEFPLSFTGTTREIRVNGEAYIKVAKDATKPFIVHLPQSSVQVLGTAFNVNTYDGGIEKVALVEGSVSLKVPGGESRIIPGNQAVYTAGQTVAQEAFDPKYVLSWRNGLYYFNDASLAEISKVVPRWFGINLEIDNPAINDRRFTGVIDRKKPVTVFLDDLKAIAKIESSFDKDGNLHLK